MHIFFFFRGLEHYVNLYKAHIQGIYWRWKRVNLKTGKVEETLVQGGLRASYLGSYEYIFPEECLAEVIAVLGLVEHQPFRMKGLRTMFGLKKIPHKVFEEARKIKTDISIKDSCRGLTAIHVSGTGCDWIGIKKDVRGEMYGFIQEAL